MPLFVHPRHEDTLISSVGTVIDDGDFFVVPTDCEDTLHALNIPFTTVECPKSLTYYRECLIDTDVVCDTNEELLNFFADVAADTNNLEELNHIAVLAVLAGIDTTYISKNVRRLKR